MRKKDCKCVFRYHFSLKVACQGILESGIVNNVPYPLKINLKVLREKKIYVMEIQIAGTRCYPK